MFIVTNRIELFFMFPRSGWQSISDVIQDAGGSQIPNASRGRQLLLFLVSVHTIPPQKNKKIKYSASSNKKAEVISPG
mgnify:CR=1 FL=1|jgi:hypothetical protein